jgi:LmeA-like phospholipid-binding
MTHPPIRGRRRRRGWLIALVTVVALAIATGVAELVVRDNVTSAISSEAEKTLHASTVNVGLGATPVLYDLAAGDIGTVSLTAASASLCQMSGVRIAAQLHGVSTRQTAGGGTPVDSADATVTLGPSTLEALVTRGAQAAGSAIGQHGAAGGPVTVVPDAATGTLRVELGPAGLIDIVERPALNGQALTLTIESISLAGRRLPVGLASKLSGLVSADTSHSLTGLPLGLRADTVTVNSGGLVFVLHGGPTRLTSNAGSTAC